MAAARPARDAPPVHGDGGCYYAGRFVELEDLGRAYCPPTTVYSDATRIAPPPPVTPSYDADVVIIGAGCVGAAIARELSRTKLRVVLLEQSDDVTQGATKGNSGIVHAGFDDAPGSVRARLCWKGNQLFTKLDEELRFGLQRNGSLVVARGAADEETLRELLARGRTNGVANLRIVDTAELRRMEPLIAPDATAALFSPDAGTLTPYEFTIALAENAVDNGVELRLRRTVTGLTPIKQGGFLVSSLCGAGSGGGSSAQHLVFLGGSPLVVGAAVAALSAWQPALLGAWQPALARVWLQFGGQAASALPLPPAVMALATAATAFTLLLLLLVHALSGSKKGSSGTTETLRARFVVNAAGNGAAAIAALAGDTSFYMKPRIGEYLLLHKKEGRRARHILFPAPSKMGKGVLVQTTLWGNLILGPTAADLSDPATSKRTPTEIMQTILARCRDLVPSLDAGEVIHSFSGVRAKSSRGDWIIERSTVAPDLLMAAGIDSPGLAGSPAIALEIVALLAKAGLPMPPNPSFNPHRRPIITAKDLRDPARSLGASISRDGSVVMKHIHLKGSTPDTLVVCKCEKVTEAEIVDAIHRSLPCDSTQAVRKRTRAGMGHCQGEYCESRVRAIIARETRRSIEAVSTRPWPASSILPQRWLSEEEKGLIRELGKE